jgi:OOP family OmpA-OmpF porin
LIDRLDKCPKEAGLQENGGCPDHDTDGDGVVDRLDKCIATAGPKGNGGCPWPDADGDGIPDKDDKCPSQPETVNSYQDEDGCPDTMPVQVKRYTGIIPEIDFELGSAILARSSLKTLDKVVQVLKDYPEVRLEISGHTDSAGSRDANVELSKQRADAVAKYLVDHRIERDRITTIGYGPDKPIATNDTSAGRKRNRRVEFRLVSRSTQEATQPPLAPASGSAIPAAPAPKLDPSK